MANKNPKVDAYIAKSAPFAQPILKRIREVVHAACPDVEEAIKWGSPFFLHHGILCYMPAFKEHCAFGFWHPKMRDLLKDKEPTSHAAGQFGRLTKASDLPAKAAFTRLVKQAMDFNENVPKSRGKATAKSSVRKAAPKKKRPATVPPEFAAALAKNKKAKSAFDAFSPSHQREYIEWIADAKRDETRQRRIKQALEQLAEGKSRHWKYQ
jgi:uncharacterized protein YdeI (YjbR/CyaY-like superfamily)